MSDTSSNFFANLPGMDFFNTLSSAQSASLSPWLKPSMDPRELDKRIEELKTVQFWLEQNAKALAATVQGLQVQRATLDTLQKMNVDWRAALQASPKSGKSAPRDASAHSPDAAAPATGLGASANDALRLWTDMANQFGQIAQQSLAGMQQPGSTAETHTDAASAPAAKTAGKPEGKGKPVAKSARRPTAAAGAQSRKR